VRYVEVRAARTSFEVCLHAVEDVGGDGFFDLGEFPPFDSDDEAGEFGRLLGRTEDPLAALIVAEQRTGTGRDRWVNEGIVQVEYGDFVWARVSCPRMPRSRVEMVAGPPPHVSRSRCGVPRS
jgi:hypothetical protein